MAIQYRLLKNKIKSSKNYGKYYAHTVKRGVISMEEVESMIEQNCSATAADVRLVLRELFDTIKFLMQSGYTVDLREMGKFSITVKSVCVDHPSEFRNDTHIVGFKGNYTPHGKRYNTSDSEVKRQIQRGLLEGCKAERMH